MQDGTSSNQEMEVDNLEGEGRWQQLLLQQRDSGLTPTEAPRNFFHNVISQISK